jgi:hypothetical protein
MVDVEQNESRHDLLSHGNRLAETHSCWQLARNCDILFRRRRAMKIVFLFLAAGLWFLLSAHSQVETGFEFKFIDNYLKQWDEFARGANDLWPVLRENASRFEKELARSLAAKDPRAPSLVVFYAVVQVGGFIPVDGAIGRPLSEMVSGDVPVFIDKNGQKRYFAGDLYCWWEAGGHGFPHFQLYEEWKKREYAQKTVIPWYRAGCEKKK